MRINADKLTGPHLEIGFCRQASKFGVNVIEPNPMASDDEHCKATIISIKSGSSNAALPHSSNISSPQITRHEDSLLHRLHFHRYRQPKHDIEL